jgi:hypothetical protein
MTRSVALSILLSTAALAQSNTQHMSNAGQTEAMNHTATMNHQAAPSQAAPTEGGQSAFAAIQEISAILLANPETDWSRVSIEKLRLHLIDMDNVTLRAKVQARDIPGGVQYAASSNDRAVIASIQSMVIAHVATMNGVEGWQLGAAKTNKGAILTVKSRDADLAKIRALGFIGVMTAGAHHQSHHLALALGNNPHEHTN